MCQTLECSHLYIFSMATYYLFIASIFVDVCKNTLEKFANDKINKKCDESKLFVEV